MTEKPLGKLYTRIHETLEGTPGMILRSIPLPFEIGTWMEVLVYEDHIIITPKDPPFYNLRTQ